MCDLGGGGWLACVNFCSSASCPGVITVHDLMFYHGAVVEAATSRTCLGIQFCHWASSVPTCVSNIRHCN